MDVLILFWLLSLSSFFVIVVMVSIDSLCKVQPEGKRITIVVDRDYTTNVRV